MQCAQGAWALHCHYSASWGLTGCQGTSTELDVSSMWFPVTTVAVVPQAALASPRALPHEPCPPTSLEAAVFAPVTTSLIVGIQPAAADVTAPGVGAVADSVAPSEEVVAAIVEPSSGAVIVVQTDAAADNGDALTLLLTCRETTIDASRLVAG